MNEKRTKELEREIAHLEAKFASIKRRHTTLQAKVDRIFRRPLSFLLWRWYHTYIKRDQII